MSDSATSTPVSAPVPAPAASSSPPATPEEEGRGPVRKIILAVVIVAAIVGLGLLIASFDAARHWFAFHTGILHGGPDPYYNFWSGFGSDLGEATLISAVSIGVYTGVRKVNCHTKGCWRIGHHALEGTPYILCRKHHPGVPTHGATHEHILELHRKIEEAKAAQRDC
jgi:hypothetical protein